MIANHPKCFTIGFLYIFSGFLANCNPIAKHLPGEISYILQNMGVRLGHPLVIALCFHYLCRV